MIHVTRSIALDLAQYDIRVNCLVPGHIRTGDHHLRHGRGDEVHPAAAARGPARGRRRRRRVPASDRAAQITGIVLPVDGGTTAGPPAAQLKLIMSPCGRPET